MIDSIDVLKDNQKIFLKLIIEKRFDALFDEVNI